MRLWRRRAVLLCALGSAALVLGSGCSTDGTTPDCTLPESNCGPDLDGALGEGEAASEAAPPIDTGADAAEAGLIDAPVDAKIDGDAGPG